MKNLHRKIESVLDYKNGKEIKISEILNLSEHQVFLLREKLEKAIQYNVPFYVCFYCKQKVKLRGGIDKKKSLHFAHLKDSEECPIKTDSKYSKEEIERIKYNGVKESDLHIKLKNFIANKLLENEYKRGGIKNVAIEKVQKSERISKEWKKPDVSAIYNGQNIVFEIQLSTTFLSAIVKRQIFYFENKTFILWVFNKFETEEDKRKFTQSDIFYTNNRNGFVLDKTAIEKSEREKELYLHCYFLKPELENDEIVFLWKDEYVTLKDLHFDEKKYKVYFFNVEKEEEILKELVLFEQEGKTELIKLFRLIQIEGSKKKSYSLELEKNGIIVKNIDNFDFKKYKLAELFKNNYRLNDIEKVFLKKKFEYIKKTNILPETDDVLIIWIIIFAKLNSREKINRVILDFRLASIIFHILSIKFKIVINNKLDKLISQIHVAIMSRKEYLNLILKALKIYDKKNMILKQDKNKKLFKKIDYYNEIKPTQNIDNNDILKIFFPELF